MKINPTLSIEQYDKNNAEHERAVAAVITWSKVATMKQIKPERQAAFPLSLLAFDSGRNPVGHVALTVYNSEGKWGMVGGQVTSPDYLRRGVAFTLLRRLMPAVRQEFPELQECFAYVNERSKALYEDPDIGGEFARKRRPIPATGCEDIVNMMPAVHTWPASTEGIQLVQPIFPLIQSVTLEV